MTVSWTFLGVLLLAECASGLIEVRLIGGKHLYEGRVEVEHHGKWKGVCDHGWNKKAAQVVCRMLGFPDALRYTKGLVQYISFVADRYLIDRDKRLIFILNSNPMFSSLGDRGLA